MGGVTNPPWSIPYPTGTDRVMDGDNAMTALAERVHTLFATYVPVPRTMVGVAPINGWAGSITHFSQAGIAHVFIDIGKSGGWGPEILGTIQTPHRPYFSLYAWGVGSQTGNPKGIALGTDGVLSVVTAGSASDYGVTGFFTFPYNG